MNITNHKFKVNNEEIHLQVMYCGGHSVALWWKTPVRLTFNNITYWLQTLIYTVIKIYHCLWFKKSIAKKKQKMKFMMIKRRMDLFLHGRLFLRVLQVLPSEICKVIKQYIWWLYNHQISSNKKTNYFLTFNMYIYLAFRF